ncbi:unnamed protein product [Diamesa tonsa]
MHEEAIITTTTTTSSSKLNNNSINSHHCNQGINTVTVEIVRPQHHHQQQQHQQLQQQQQHNLNNNNNNNHIHHHQQQHHQDFIATTTAPSSSTIVHADGLIATQIYISNGEFHAIKETSEVLNGEVDSDSSNLVIVETYDDDKNALTINTSGEASQAEAVEIEIKEVLSGETDETSSGEGKCKSF